MAAFATFNSVHAPTRRRMTMRRMDDFREVASRTGAAAAETVVLLWTLGVLAFGFLVTVGFFER